MALNNHTSILLLISSLMFLASIILAVISTRRQNQFQRIIRDGAKGYERMSQDLASALKSLEIAQREKAKSLVELETARKNAAAAQAKLAQKASSSSRENNTSLEQVQADLQRKLTNTEAQRDLLIAKSEAFEKIQTRIQADLNAKILELEAIKENSQQARADANSERQVMRAKISELEGFLATERKLVADHTANTQEKIDPKDYEVVKRKAAMNEQLYLSMKSLRTMAEERNKNWEGALRSLSTWILTQSSLAIPHDPVLSKSIGPLVGEALERVGSTLVEADGDQFHPPAPLSGTMTELAPSPTAVV